VSRFGCSLGWGGGVNGLFVIRVGFEIDVQGGEEGGCVESEWGRALGEAEEGGWAYVGTQRTVFGRQSVVRRQLCAFLPGASPPRAPTHGPAPPKTENPGVQHRFVRRGLVVVIVV
jgi:hypothetical protein